MAAKFYFRKNGPIVIEGEFELVDDLGNSIVPPGQAKVALCRCGASERKPFCDGTHKKIGFCDGSEDVLINS